MITCNEYLHVPAAERRIRVFRSPGKRYVSVPGGKDSAHQKPGYPRGGRRYSCGKDDRTLAERIEAFSAQRKPEHVFHSLVVHFPESPTLSEIEFEAHLFARLQGIHDVDRLRFAWDPSVSDDTASKHFSMSVGGESFYVIGLHPGASRVARRFAHPAMVFNLHAQFEYLREHGRYDRLREAIIDRDIEANGSANPMLAVHGHSSEAMQYSGRHIEGAWECPFKPHGSTQ